MIGKRKLSVGGKFSFGKREISIRERELQLNVTYIGFEEIGL